MANKYLITGGGNWSGSSWNTASNQATSNTTAPTTSDVAILDQYSGQCTIDTTTCVAQQLNCTGYTNTLTFTSGQKLTITTNITLSAGMTINGTGDLQTGSGTATWNWAGQTISGNLIIAAAGGTKTWTGNLTVTGITSITTSNIAISGGSSYNLYANGGWQNATTNTGYFSTATKANHPTIWLQGGTINGTMGAREFKINGNITFATATTSYTTEIRDDTLLTYVSGTVTTTDSMLRVINGATFDINNNFELGALYWTSGTITLKSNLTLTDDLGTVSNTTAILNGIGKILTIKGNTRF